jgi:hypothetical protein
MGAMRDSILPFIGLLALVVSIASFLMNFARTPPDEARTNFSKWLAHIPVTSAPARSMFAILFLIGLGLVLWPLRSTGPSNQQSSTVVSSKVPSEPKTSKGNAPGAISLPTEEILDIDSFRVYTIPLPEGKTTTFRVLDGSMTFTSTDSVAQCEAYAFSPRRPSGAGQAVKIEACRQSSKVKVRSE